MHDWVLFSSYKTPPQLSEFRSLSRASYPAARAGIVDPIHIRKAASFTVGVILIHSGIPLLSKALSVRSYQAPPTGYAELSRELDLPEAETSENDVRVQAMTRDQLAAEDRQIWSAAAVQVMHKTYPTGVDAYRPKALRDVTKLNYPNQHDNTLCSLYRRYPPWN